MSGFMASRFRQIVGVHQFKHFFALLKRNCSTQLVPTAELVEKRNYLFSLEQKRQLEEIGRVEKVTVEVKGPPENVVLVMNQNISTPYDCCKHISQSLCQQAALALVNDNILWDMHRPLPGNCSVRFLQFKDKDPYSLNKTFWRTGSFVLGAVISKAFKNNVQVLLHSFPPPFVKSGSFVYDVQMNLNKWIPTEDELRVLSTEFISFVYQNHKIERLKVKKSIAVEIFEGNHIKQHQIPQIAANAEDHLVTLYRVGDHIDISNGPMVADTSFFGRSAVTAVHQICGRPALFRFQGVSLPKGILLNSYAFDILRARGARLNEADYPNAKSKMDNPYGMSTVVKKNSELRASDEPFQQTEVFR